MKKTFLLFFAFGIFTIVKSQNLLLNSDMSAGSTNWDGGGACIPEIGGGNVTCCFYLFEDIYGGPSTTNIVSEVDALSCMQQTVNVNSGSTYTINFDATRRTTCGAGGPGDLGLNPGINVKVTGVTSGTVYSTIDYHYTNLTWVGYTAEVQSFSIPAVTTDAQVRIDIIGIDNPEGCGIVMDNVTMVLTSVLSVNLASFNATNKNNTVDLSWVTSNEVNNDYFEVYRSKNGVGFTLIGKVNASGLSSGATYTFNDAQPGSGTTYYRLKMVDKTANSKFSGIVKTNLNAKTLDVAVYPTIVTGVLNYVVESPKAEKLKVLVTDVSGKRLVSRNESFNSGTTQKSINTSTFASGVYLLTIIDENGTFKKTVTFKKD